MDVVLLAFGGIMMLVGWIWILINAFSESILWGLACLCLNPVGTIVYGVLRWHDLKFPTLLYVFGLLLYGASKLIG